MKCTAGVLRRLFIALTLFILTVQLFLFAATPARAAAQNTNTNTASTIAQTHGDHSAMRPTRRNRCRESCSRQYRQCLRGVANPSQARCRQRYNGCLRRCRR
ncbi:MAG TPA: hypothetical protein VEY11_12760 [Pyrinomonadaceae bacterium]|nr:hypothetical protein [Pyrinomonadaceae bacterium]